MRIAQIVSRQHWETKLDRSRWLSVDPLEPFRTGNGWDGYDANRTIGDNLQSLTGELPDVVIAYKPLEHGGFADLQCITAMQFNECRRKRFPVEVEQARPTMVIFHHLADFQTWAEWCRARDVEPVHIPHVADPAIFFDRGDERPIDFLLVGAVGSKIYPLRNRMREAIPLMREMGLRAEVHRHPGHAFQRADTLWHLHEFAESLNRAKVVGFCSSIYRYRLQKYVEVPACGAVVAADYPLAEVLQPAVVAFAWEPFPGESAENIADTVSCHLGLVESMRPRSIQYASKYTPANYCERLTAELERMAVCL